jgi:transcriptional regulator with GAF, ATPase, and Fis domain
MKMGSLKEKIKDIEKEEILNALNECNWVMARAARKLGITERMIGYKVKKYGIRREATPAVTFTGGNYFE